MQIDAARGKRFTAPPNTWTYWTLSGQRLTVPCPSLLDTAPELTDEPDVPDTLPACDAGDQLDVKDGAHINIHPTLADSLNRHLLKRGHPPLDVSRGRVALCQDHAWRAWLTDGSAVTINVDPVQDAINIAVLHTVHISLYVR